MKRDYKNREEELRETQKLAWIIFTVMTVLPAATIFFLFIGCVPGLLIFGGLSAVIYGVACVSNCMLRWHRWDDSSNYRGFGNQTDYEDWLNNNNRN